MINPFTSPFFFGTFIFFFLFCLLWTVTWTTIRLAGTSHLSYPDYQILFTCKLVISHILIYFIISHISEQSLRLVTIINSACAAFLIITIYQGLFHQTSLNCQSYEFCMVSAFMEHKYIYVYHVNAMIFKINELYIVLCLSLINKLIISKFSFSYTVMLRK